jgi:periplasmic divalent cation tolerance protein
VVQRLSIILTTTDDKEVVNQIINNLLTTHLAACVQVDEMDSYFRWEGQIVSQKEYRVVIKAKSDNYNDIEALIMAVHNYDLPQIIKLEIQGGLPAYLNWAANGL